MSVNITTLFLLTCLLHVSARTTGQVTLKEKSATLESVLVKLEKQSSGYGLSYDLSLVRAKGRPVAVNVANVPIESALQEIFKSQDLLTYSINGKMISVRERDGKKLDAITEGLDPRLETAPPPANIDVTITVIAADNNQTLEGASVMIKGQNKGIATDINGRAALKNIDPNATVVISFTGYTNQEIKIAGRNSVVVKLIASANELDEIQIGAYSKTSRRLQIGNVSTVKGEDIAKQPVSNPLLALEGRVPGLFIAQSNGLPGSGVKVRIQGQNSIQGGNDPLYVIDGVPYVSQMLLGTFSGSVLGNSGTSALMQGGAGNPLSFINPNDIESIEVLKDADATSIYGSRAANGAILITTKKGKAEQTKVDINLQQGWGKVSRTLEMMNTQQYLKMRREALYNDNLAPVATRDYDLMLWDTTRYTDWAKLFLGGTAKYTNLSASVSGGTSNMQFLVGSTYRRETTVFPGDFEDQKGSVHFNVSANSPNRKFRLDFSGSYLTDNNQLPGTDLTNYAYKLSPNAPALYKEDGTFNWAPNVVGNSSWANPLAQAFYNTYNVKTSNLNSSLLLSYKLLDGIDLSNRFGYVELGSKEYAPGSLLAESPENRISSLRSARYSNNSIKIFLIEPQVSYKGVIGSGRFDAVLGMTFQQNRSEGSVFSGVGYPTEESMKDIRSATNVTIASSINSYYKYNAGFGRLNYNWKNKYIVDFNARRDGSSRFGPENRFHNFASAAAAWIFSEESFAKNRFSILSFGKLKASYGSSGNDQIGDYSFIDLYSINTNGVPYQGEASIIPTRIPNPYLQWEDTKKMSFGIDLGFINDRILISATFARNRSSNQLLPYALPIMSGFSSVSRNFPATVQNTSGEISLSTVNIKNENFQWSTNFNITIPKNKLIEFSNLEKSSYAGSLIIGQSLTVSKVYHFLGVDPATGSYQFANMNGTPTSIPNFLTDRTVLIHGDPKFYGGFQNTLRYRGFEIDFFFQFVKQNQSSLTFYAFGNSASPPGRGVFNQPTSVVDHWQKPGDITGIQRYSTSTPFRTGWSNANTSDAGYTDASYIRLKNLSISYDLAPSIIKQAHIKACKFYLQGQNLVTITNFKGVDPENQAGDALAPLKVWTLGLKISL